MGFLLRLGCQKASVLRIFPSIDNFFPLLMKVLLLSGWSNKSGEIVFFVYGCTFFEVGPDLQRDIFFGPKSEKVQKRQKVFFFPYYKSG